MEMNVQRPMCINTLQANGYSRNEILTPTEPCCAVTQRNVKYSLRPSAVDQDATRWHNVTVVENRALI